MNWHAETCGGINFRGRWDFEEIYSCCVYSSSWGIPEGIPIAKVNAWVNFNLYNVDYNCSVAHTTSLITALCIFQLIYS